jgi:hypothetical protein
MTAQCLTRRRHHQPLIRHQLAKTRGAPLTPQRIETPMLSTTARPIRSAITAIFGRPHAGMITTAAGRRETASIRDNRWLGIT